MLPIPNNLHNKNITVQIATIKPRLELVNSIDDRKNRNKNKLIKNMTIYSVVFGSVK